MGCDCKKSLKISKTNLQEKPLLTLFFEGIKKIGLFAMSLVLVIILTPIVIVCVAYTMIFKGRGYFPVPNKILNMLK